ncbi:MAG: cysteine desulfurase [Gemmataceae bacterium]|nr:cysteine desulfurase [Gemmataceae bacterium]
MQPRLRIYLDCNSTSPMLPEVWEAMKPFASEDYGNPASSHAAGRKARQALEDAREEIASLLGAFADEVFFTSGATEGNNQAILGAAGKGNILASPIEHPSIMEPLKVLEKQGREVEWLKVDPQGLALLPEELPAEVALCVLMLVNHETGMMQPVEEMGKLAEGKAWFHCDAAQAAGKIKIDFHRLRPHSLTLSAHKFNGPKGAGVLLIRRGSSCPALLHGGHQQHGLRPGTESPGLAVGGALALRKAMEQLSWRRDKVAALRKIFVEAILQAIPGVWINGEENPLLPHTINLGFPGLRGDILLMRLDLEGVCCSTGSACSSGSLLPSPVLLAMGQSPERARSAMRFSLGHLLGEEEAREGAARVVETARQLYKNSGEIESFRK